MRRVGKVKKYWEVDKDFHIKDEFKNLIPFGSDAEKDLLKTQAIETGELTKQAIIGKFVGKDTKVMVDGHEVWDVACELGLPCPIITIEFESKEEAKEYAIQAQLGLRNLTPTQKVAIYLMNRETFTNIAMKLNKDEGENVKSATLIARACGVGTSTVESIIYVDASDAELVKDALHSCLIKPRTARDLVGYDESELDPVFKMLATKETRARGRRELNVLLRRARSSKPDGKFDSMKVMKSVKSKVSSLVKEMEAGKDVHGLKQIFELAKKLDTRVGEFINGKTDPSSRSKPKPDAKRSPAKPKNYAVGKKAVQSASKNKYSKVA